MFDIVAIISTLKKNLSRKDLFIIVLLIGLYFLTRLYNLKGLPIFTDEGIYIRWAKVAWHDASWRFISLTDGRQPLQTWGTIAMLKLFPESPLFAGRMFSVMTGFAAVSGMFSLLWYLFEKKTAYIGAFLYILTPSFLFYDRIALVDSAVNAGVIWILLFSIILAQLRRLDVALILGGIFGFSLLAKSSVKLYMILASLVVVFIIFSDAEDGFRNSLTKIVEAFKKRQRLLLGRAKVAMLLSFGLLYGIAAFIGYIIYNVQRLSPFFHYVAEKNKTFVLTGSELLNDPFSLLLANLPKIPYYLFSEMGYVIPIIGLVGLIFLYRKNKPLGLYFGLFFFGAYLMIGSVAKVLFPRYLLPLGSVLFIPSIYVLTTVSKRNKIILWVAVLVSIIIFDYAILFNPVLIPFPAVDRGQYIEGVTAGWGVTEIIDFAREKSIDKPVVLVAEGNFGLIADMLESSKNDSDVNIEIKGYWPLDLRQLQENQPLLTEKHVYAIFSHRQEFPTDWPIKLIKQYDKPGGKSPYYLFELTR